MQSVLNCANFCVASIIRGILPTATKLYSGSRERRSECSGNSRPVRRTLSLTGWEQSSPVDEEEIKNKKWMTVSILHSLRRELTYLLTCGRRSLVSGTQNDIVVSWKTLWWMIKVYWLEPTFCIMLSAALLPQVRGRSLHLIISHLRMKRSSSNCPNHVRRTKISIKKRVIVRQTVRSMFGEQTRRTTTKRT